MVININDKEKYSFIVTNGEDLNRENCRCYVVHECFKTYLFNPSNIQYPDH